LLQRVVTPWPAYLVMASRETVQSKGSTITKFLSFLKSVCSSFKENEDNHATNYLYELAHVSTSFSTLMLHRTDWACSRHVQIGAFEEPLKWFKTLGWVKSDVKCNVSKYLADGVVMIEASTNEGTEESDSFCPDLQDAAEGGSSTCGSGRLGAAPAG